VVGDEGGGQLSPEIPAALGGTWIWEDQRHGLEDGLSWAGKARSSISFQVLPFIDNHPIN
jgi:hypothetical protein